MECDSTSHCRRCSSQKIKYLSRDWVWYNRKTDRVLSKSQDKNLSWQLEETDNLRRCADHIGSNYNGLDIHLNQSTKEHFLCPRDESRLEGGGKQQGGRTSLGERSCNFLVFQMTSFGTNIPRNNKYIQY